MGKPGENDIRIVSDGLIDEAGTKWDRVRGRQYFLTRDEVAALGSPRRLLTSAGYGSSVVEVSAAEFHRQLSVAKDHRVVAFRSTRDGGDTALLLSASDC